MQDSKIKEQHDLGILKEFSRYKGIDYRICTNGIDDPDKFTVFVGFAGRGIDLVVPQDISEYESLGDARDAAIAIIDNYLRSTKPEKQQQSDPEYTFWLVRFPSETNTTVIRVTGYQVGMVYYYDYNSDIEQMIQKDELEIVSTEGIRPWSELVLSSYVGKVFFNLYTGSTATAIAHAWGSNTLIFYDGEVSWEESAINLLMSYMIEDDCRLLHAGIVGQREK